MTEADPSPRPPQPAGRPQADAPVDASADARPADAPVDAPAALARPIPVQHRYRLTIAYDGSRFHGWQKQEPPDGKPLRTVAGVVESTLMRVMGQPINLVGASRTDAGVHALGQVAQFDAATRIPIERMAEAINSRLPADVEVIDARIAPDDFQAIRGAQSKQYRYRLFNTARRPLGLRHMVWHCWWELDLAKMNDAAARLVGTHDFAGFTAANHGRLTTVRTIFDCHVQQASPEVHLVVSGSGFLYNMVRIIAGTLVEVGRGRFEPDVIDRVLKTGDRRQAGTTLPPEGLWLEWIHYEGDPPPEAPPEVPPECPPAAPPAAPRKHPPNNLQDGASP